jgi:hypothetical protein
MILKRLLRTNGDTEWPIAIKVSYANLFENQHPCEHQGAILGIVPLGIRLLHAKPHAAWSKGLWVPGSAAIGRPRQIYRHRFRRQNHQG